MSAIAILGSGRVGGSLAAKLTEAGHAVVFGSGDLAAAEIVINALPGEVCLDVLKPLAEQLSGKILIDLANATRRGTDGLPATLLHPGGSLGAEIQRALPRTRVVKTLNTMLYTVMTNPTSLSSPVTAFLSGDDTAAKRVVAELLGDLGWPSDWILDLGGIDTAQAPEAFVLLVPRVFAARGGVVPFGLSISS